VTEAKSSIVSAKSRGNRTVRIERLCCLGIRSVRRADGSRRCGSSWNKRAIENVRKLDTNQHRLAFCDSEEPPQTHRLLRTALLPVVVIERLPRTKTTCGRIHPGIRIQHEFLVGIVTMAVQILEEQRLTRNAFRKRRAAGARTQRDRVQIVLCKRSKDG